jgi:hypothetical protein
MRKVVKAAGEQSSITYLNFSNIAVSISTLDYPAARFALGEDMVERVSDSVYMGISRIYFRKNKRSLPEGMSKPSKLTQHLRDPN